MFIVQNLLYIRIIHLLNGCAKRKNQQTNLPSGFCFLQDFDLSISHIKSSLNLVADSLSRNPDASRSGPGGCEIERHVVSLFVSDQERLRLEELAFLQQLDCHLRSIILKEQKLNSQSQKLKSEFVLINGVLFKCNARGRFQFAVPSQL